MSGTVVAVAVARARRRIVERFTLAGATDAAHPIEFTPEGRLERRIFARMLAFGAAVKEGDRYWLDEKRLADFQKESLARVLGVLALAGFAAAGAIAFGG